MLSGWGMCAAGPVIGNHSRITPVNLVLAAFIAQKAAAAETERRHYDQGAHLTPSHLPTLPPTPHPGRPPVPGPGQGRHRTLLTADDKSFVEETGECI